MAMMLQGKDKEKPKKKPVKAQPKTDKDGGIFTSKVILIMQEVKRKFKEWLGIEEKDDGKVSG